MDNNQDQPRMNRVFLRWWRNRQNVTPPTYNGQGGHQVAPDSSESVTAPSVFSSEEASTVRSNENEQEEHACDVAGRVPPTNSPDDVFVNVVSPDFVVEVNFMSGATTPLSTEAQYGSSSSHSGNTTDVEMLDITPDISQLLPGVGEWVPGLLHLHPPFLSNYEPDYPRSSFWKEAIRKNASAPPGAFGLLYPRELRIAIEALSRSLPLLQDRNNGLEDVDDDDDDDTD